MNEVLRAWTAAKRAELAQRGRVNLRNAIPSLRDFQHAIATSKEALAVIAEAARRTPEEGELRQSVDLVGFWDACDRSQVSAVAAPTDPRLGGSEADLQALAAGGGMPVVHHELALVPDQIYLSRLWGADAVWLHAGVLSAPELRVLAEIAGSMHMAAVVEVDEAAQIQAALAAGLRLLCFSAFDGQGGLEVGQALALAARAPAAATLIGRGPFADPAQLELVRGKLDAIWICGPVMRAADPLAFLEPLIDAAENG